MKSVGDVLSCITTLYVYGTVLLVVSVTNIICIYKSNYSSNFENICQLLHSIFFVPRNKNEPKETVVAL